MTKLLRALKLDKNGLEIQYFVGGCRVLVQSWILTSLFHLTRKQSSNLYIMTHSNDEAKVIVSSGETSKHFQTLLNGRKTWRGIHLCHEFYSKLELGRVWREVWPAVTSAVVQHILQRMIKEGFDGSRIYFSQNTLANEIMRNILFSYSSQNT